MTTLFLHHSGLENLRHLFQLFTCFYESNKDKISCISLHLSSDELVTSAPAADAEDDDDDVRYLSSGHRD